MADKSTHSPIPVIINKLPHFYRSHLVIETFGYSFNESINQNGGASPDTVYGEARAICMENVRCGVVLLDLIIFIKGGASPDTVYIHVWRLL